MRFLRNFITLALLAAAAPAIAQSIQQSGSVTAGHGLAVVSSGVVKDAGTNLNPALNSLALYGSGGCPLSITSTTSPGTPSGNYVQGCLSASSSSGVTLSVTPYGSLSTLPFNIAINGTTYAIGGTGWLSTLIDQQFGSTQGELLTRGVSGWQALPPGLTGQALVSNGAGANLSWAAAAGVGTVTSITAGTGLSGGTITSSGAISLASPVSVANGGTGATALAAHGVLLGNTTSAVNVATPGTAGYCLTSNGTTSDPTFQACPGSGTVTSIMVGLGLTATPSPITSSGSISVTANGITNGLLAQMASNTIKGNNTGSSGNPSDLTQAQAQALLAIQPTPQGRLTLTSATPVMTTDTTAATTIYYACYSGNLVPVYDGTDLSVLAIGSCNLAMGLDAVTPHVALGSVYDIFGISSGGALALCVGPAWSTTATRGSGAGSTAIDQTIGGLWTNTNALTHCYGGASGTTDYGSVAAHRGTYLGSFYASANGQTEMQFTPTAAAGGTNNVLGLYNGYNRVSYNAFCRDSTLSWTNTSSAIRGANGSSANRVNFLDGLAQSTVFASYSVLGAAGVSSEALIGLALDSSLSIGPGVSIGSSTTASLMTQVAFAPNLGFHYVQATEANDLNAGTVTFYGLNHGFQKMNLNVDLMM